MTDEDEHLIIRRTAFGVIFKGLKTITLFGHKGSRHGEAASVQRINRFIVGPNAISISVSPLV